MSISTALLTGIRCVFAAVSLTLCIAEVAHAQAYDFNTFLRGGGRGNNGKGAYICLNVTERPTSSGNSVQFMIRSMFPDPDLKSCPAVGCGKLKPEIGGIVFDTGRHAGLFSNLSVVIQSPGMKAAMVPPMEHAFLPGLTPEYQVSTPTTSSYRPDITPFGPGKLVVISAVLAPGKTFANVISALDEGINPATAAKGLRVGVVVLYLLGGPPKGVASINDDGGFVTARRSQLCGRS